jgi:hypothetical protein
LFAAFGAVAEADVLCSLLRRALTRLARGASRDLRHTRLSSAAASAPADDTRERGEMGKPLDELSGAGATGFSSRRPWVRDDAYWKVREERAHGRIGEKT